MAVQIIFGWQMQNGLKLAAGYAVKQNPGPNFSKEIYVGVIKDNVWYQDLAIVRSVADQNDNEFEVLVYADKDSEDYIDQFRIGLSQEDE